MRLSVILCPLALFLANPLDSQQARKIYISVDMEGVGGVTNPADVGMSLDPDYEYFRRVMTDEVNAAVESAIQGGATEVLVEEHHGGRGFRNILLDRLHPSARLIRGWPRPRGGITGLDSSFAAAMFLGYHAREGTPKAVLAHSFLDYAVKDIRINGRSVGEGEFNAIVAGAQGVPVIMVAGDDAMVAQMREFLGDVEGAVVKWAVTRTSAIVEPPSLSTASVRAAADRAMHRLSEFRAVRMPAPYRFEFTFKPAWDERIDRIASANPEIVHSGARVLARTCQNLNELIDFYLKALDIGPESSPTLK